MSRMRLHDSGAHSHRQAKQASHLRNNDANDVNFQGEDGADGNAANNGELDVTPFVDASRAERARRVITEQFEREIELRKEELTIIENNLFETQTLLDKLRVAILSSDDRVRRRKPEEGGALSHNTPLLSTRPKAPAANTSDPLFGRHEDGSFFRYVCPACKRDHFVNGGGFIAHCRIAHGFVFSSIEHAARLCGQTVAETDVPPLDACRTRIDIPLIPSHPSVLVPVDFSPAAPRGAGAEGVGSRGTLGNIKADLSAVGEDGGSRFYVTKRIIVGNTSKYIPPDKREADDESTHKWMVYVRGPAQAPSVSHFVKKVWFFLHPSYRPNDVVEVSSPPFQLTRRGWGEFPVRVQLHFVDSRNKPVDIIHSLKLDRTYSGLQKLGTETIVDVELNRFYADGTGTTAGLTGSTQSDLPNATAPPHSNSNINSGDLSAVNGGHKEEVDGTPALNTASSAPSDVPNDAGEVRLREDADTTGERRTLERRSRGYDNADGSEVDDSGAVLSARAGVRADESAVDGMKHGGAAAEGGRSDERALNDSHVAFEEMIRRRKQILARQAQMHEHHPGSAGGTALDGDGGVAGSRAEDAGYVRVHGANTSGSAAECEDVRLRCAAGEDGGMHEDGIRGDAVSERTERRLIACVRQFPLIVWDGDAMTDHDRQRLSYRTANSLHAFLSWPVGKRKSAEWQRARCIKKRMAAHGDVLSTRTVMRWCSTNGFTPQPAVPRTGLKPRQPSVRCKFCGLKIRVERADTSTLPPLSSVDAGDASVVVPLSLPPFAERVPAELSLHCAECARPWFRRGKLVVSSASRASRLLLVAGDGDDNEEGRDTSEGMDVDVAEPVSAAVMGGGGEHSDPHRAMGLMPTPQLQWAMDAAASVDTPLPDSARDRQLVIDALLKACVAFGRDLLVSAAAASEVHASRWAETVAARAKNAQSNNNRKRRHSAMMEGEEDISGENEDEQSDEADGDGSRALRRKTHSHGLVVPAHVYTAANLCERFDFLTSAYMGREKKMMEKSEKKAMELR
eukprot:Opistho-2@83312